MDFFYNLNPILQGLLATLFTYLVTCLGASLVFFFKKVNMKILDLMMGLASGIMIATSFWSLLQPSIDLCLELGKKVYLLPPIGFMCGGLFIIITDIILQRTEKLNDGKKKSILLSFAVTMHNIPEGMAVGVAFGTFALGLSNLAFYDAVMLALGIGIQNFPEGVCVAMPLRANGYSRKKSFMIGQFSGLVEPIFGVLGVIFALTIQSILPFLLSFSAGAMIAVVCSELIPDSFKDNKIVASLGVIIGFVIMMILDVSLG